MAPKDGQPFRLGILASRNGSNLQAILDRCLSDEISACVSVVISNNSKSGALRRAKDVGIPTFHLSGWTHPEPDRLDGEMTRVLQDHGVDLVVLAGYMKKLGPVLLQAYPNRILNVHPALLPAFGGQGMYGMQVHRAVIESGVKVTGVTVHLADSEYDQGLILAQEVITVHPADTPEGLAKRVLKLEHRLLPVVIQRFAEGQFETVH